MTLQQQNMSVFGEGNFSLKEEFRRGWWSENLERIYCFLWLIFFWGVNDLHLDMVIFKHIYSYSRWNFICSVSHTASKWILSNLDIFLWVPLHLISLRHFLTWYLIWQPFCAYKPLAYILLIFSKIFSFFQSCCSDFHLTLLPPSVDIRSIRSLTGYCILPTQAVLSFRSLMNLLTPFSEVWLKWPIAAANTLLSRTSNGLVGKRGRESVELSLKFLLYLPLKGNGNEKVEKQPIMKTFRL